MSGPRVVLFDLEILPNLEEALKSWTSLSAYPGITLRASITSILCCGWKVLGEKKTHCINAWDFPRWKKSVNDDRAVVEAIYEVLKDADCVVTHNGKRFDWKFLQTRLLFHGLPPLPRIHHVDTCAEAKKNIFVLNNRLNTLAQFFTEDEKLEHDGWKLWVQCHGREKKALKVMEEYCKQDVAVLEKIFLKLRPMITSLPNYNLFNPAKEMVCPNCGSTRLTGNGYRITRTRRYKRVRCQDCGTSAQLDAREELPR